MRQVVAAEHGERPHAPHAPRAQRRDEHRDGRNRRLRALAVRDDVRMCQVQGSGRGIVAVALLGHRERDDLRGRRAEALEHCAHVAARGQHRVDRGDHAILGALGRARVDGEQPVLRIELLRDRVAAQRDARDPPVAAPLREHGVRVDGLMRAMERAGAEVHDADAVSARIVGRAPDAVGHGRERRAGQTPRAARATDSAHASL